MRPTLLGAVLLASITLGYGCSLIATGDAKAGIGSPCMVDTECNGPGAVCLRSSVAPSDPTGVCSIPCNFPEECPSGTICAKQQCQQLLTTAFVTPDSSQNLEGSWFAQSSSITNAASNLSYILLEKQFDLIPGGILANLQDLANRNQVLIGNTVDYGVDFVAAAKLFPDKKFLVARNGASFDYPPARPQNFSTYWVRREQAWYAAGKVAATIAQKRLGVISALISPETMAYVNAFTLGAHTVKPNLVVEVRHMGFWFDINDTPVYTYTHINGMSRKYFREEYLAALMVDSGCEVIAHLGNTQRTVRLIEKLREQGLAGSTQYSFATHNRHGYLNGVAAPIPSCIGSIYENWTPIYSRILDQIQRGVHSSNTLEMDIDETDDTPVGVSINPTGPGDAIAARAYVQSLARAKNPGTRYVAFQGPYQTTGQRDSDGDGVPDSSQFVGAGEIVGDAELARMCWFVKGVVEKTKLNDPKSADRDALVPGGLVPGSLSPNTRQGYALASEDQLALPPGLSANCLENAH